MSGTSGFGKVGLRIVGLNVGVSARNFASMSQKNSATGRRLPPDPDLRWASVNAWRLVLGVWYIWCMRGATRTTLGWTSAHWIRSIATLIVTQCYYFATYATCHAKTRRQKTV